MNTPKQSKLDHVTSQRLARLSTLPVDTLRLEQRLSKHLEHGKSANPLMLRWRPAASIAAAVLIAVLIGVMSLTGPSAMASTMELSRVHQEVALGTLPAIVVADVSEARTELAALVQGSPRPTGDYPQRVRCCCGQELAGEQLAFIKMRRNEVPITVIMMRGYHACAGMDNVVTDEDGRRFIVHRENDGVQATLTTRADHWVCVMGALPTDELVNIAGQLAF